MASPGNVPINLRILQHTGSFLTRQSATRLRRRSSGMFRGVGCNYRCFWKTYQPQIHGRTRLRSRLRHYATSRKVVGSIPDGVIEIFHWHNSSSRTVALGSTHPLTEGRPVSRTGNLTTFMCRLSGNLGASTSWNPMGLYTDCFILPLKVKAQVLRNVGNYLRCETGSHTGRPGSSIQEQIRFQRRQSGQWLIR